MARSPTQVRQVSDSDRSGSSVGRPPGWSGRWGNQEVQIAAMTSQGAVRMQRSRPNSAARVASKRAIVPYPVPSTIRRPRLRTMRPRVIMNTVKVASDMNNAAPLRNIDISKTERHLGSSHRLAYWTRCRTETHGFVTSEHRTLTSTPTTGGTMI